MFDNEFYIAELISGYMRGKLDGRQEKELNTWRKAAAGNEEIFQKMISGQYWEENAGRFVKDDKETELEWQLILKKKHIRQHRLRLKQWTTYAAALLLLITSGVFVYLINRTTDKRVETLWSENALKQTHPILILPNGDTINFGNEEAIKALASKHQFTQADKSLLNYNHFSSEDSTEYHTIKIPRGGEYIVILSDSTTVFLNAESVLTYPIRFSGRERKVYLNGEAYFKVRHDPQHPFIVDVSPVKVEVLGTTFGIRAYRDESNIRTVLESGKVCISTDKHQVLLDPDMLAAFNRESESLDVESVNTSLYLSWKDGRMIFDNNLLEDIMRDLGRWYSFDIIFEKEEARHLPFSLNIKKHENVHEVLQLIEATGKVEFEIKDHTIIVK